MWILILTVFAGGTGAPAVTAVSGFQTNALCERAGTSWVRIVESAGYRADAFYRCVLAKP